MTFVWSKLLKNKFKPLYKIDWQKKDKNLDKFQNVKYKTKFFFFLSGQSLFSVVLTTYML